MKTLIMVLSLVCLCSCNTTAIYMVRHAEKVTNTNSNNPPLTAAGSARAIALKEALKDASIDAIIVSDLQRTQLTAQPLASHLNLQLIVIPLMNSTPAQYVQAVVDEINNHWVGRDVLVVTHNTLLQQIGQKLKTPPLPAIDENTGFDQCFVIQKSTSTSAISKVAYVRYGASTQ
jgi:broad specificity phosphatase PhoE